MPYRIVDTALWTDPRVKELSPKAKLFFIYLVTNPHTHVGGIYYLPDVAVAHETGLPAKDLDTLWDRVSQVGLASRDKKTEVVWVKNMLRYQGRGPKILRSVAMHIKTLHKSSLINDFLDVYPDLSRYGIDRVSQVDILMDVRERQDQDQDQEQNTPPTPPRGDTLSQVLPERLRTTEFIEAWGQWIEHRHALKRKLTPQAISQQLTKLDGWGPVRAVAALRHSIANGWQGIFEPQAGKGEPTGPAVSTTEHLENVRREREERLRREAEATGTPASPEEIRARLPSNGALPHSARMEKRS